VKAVHASVAAALAVLFVATCGSGAFAKLSVTSTAFNPGGRIALRYISKRCGGQNVSIPLAWRGLPALTRSVAVSMFDPDARSGAGVWHWIVYDIPASISRLAPAVDGAQLPKGSVTGKNTEQLEQYSGPCPPRGELHHYRITVYAIGTGFVQAMPERGAAVIVNRLTPNLLASATLIGTYGR
jgi:Raf kinase inhibitor-like YbhB/YbcL family protein